MSVVYLDHTARASGGEIALRRLLLALEDVTAHVVLGEDGPLREQLASDGHAVEVLTMRRGRDLRRTDVTSVRSTIRGGWDLLTYGRRIAKTIRSIEPDLIHANSLKSGIYGSLAGRLAGVPVVWHVRDRLAEDYMPRVAVLALRALLTLLPTAVFVNSASTAATVGRTVARRKSVAVVADPYEPRLTMRPDEPDRPYTMTMVGRLAPWKGQHLFVAAFASAFPSGDARARIVGAAQFGEADYARSLRELAVELGVESRVDFVGHTDDVEDELSRTDCLVHFSVIPEPFGQVVVEGLAAGVPVVAARAGGPTEVITDGIDGFLVTPGAVPELAGVLQRVAGNADLRVRVAQQGRRRAAAFSGPVVGPTYMRRYSEILTRPRRGRRAV